MTAPLPSFSRRRWLQAVGTIAFASLTPSVRTQSRTRHFRAGAAKVDITPETFPIRVSGSIGERSTDVVTDPLRARALVLDDGATRLALAVVDSLFIDQPTLDAAKAAASEETQIPVSHMMVSATHTHSAPPVVGCHGNDPELTYRDRLRQGIVEAIVAAAKTTVPAEIGWGSGECADFVHCRRWLMRPGKSFDVPFTDKKANLARMNPGHENPDAICQTGPRDISLPILAVRRADKRPLALLAARHGHYAGAPGISADKYGVFASEIARLLDADDAFVGMLACGFLGDANCVDFSKPRTPFNYKQVGETLARAAKAVWDAIEWKPEAALAAEGRSLEIAVRMPSPAEVAEAEAWLKKNLGAEPVRTWEQNYARETVLLSRMPATRSIPHQALRVGDLGVVTSPCEVYASTGLKVRARSPFPFQMNVGLANGYGGYLPPPDEHALGGYSTWRARSSCLAEDAEPSCAESMTRLLKQLASR